MTHRRLLPVRLATLVGVALSPALASAQAPTAEPPPGPVAAATVSPLGATYQPPAFLATPPQLPASAEGRPPWRLELAEALQLAVRHNLGVVLEREALHAARLGVDAARGRFEPSLALTYRHGDVRSPPTTSLEGQPDQFFTAVDDSLELAYQQRLPTGATIGLAWDNGRARSTSGSAVEPLSLRSTLGLTLTQPLLRGFSTDLAIPRLDVLRARLGSDGQALRLRQAIADVTLRTETAYWDVVAALYRYQVEARSAEVASQHVALIARQIDAGILPPADKIAAESTLAQRQLQLVQSEHAIAQAWDGLRAVLGVPRPRWDDPILPTEVPTFAAASTTVDEAMAAALRHRPERAQLELDLRGAELAVRGAANDRLPQVDLGLSGQLVGQDASASGALDQLVGADGRGWSVLLSMAWTPLARASSAAVEVERSRVRMARARIDQLVQEVLAEVRAAVRGQATAGLQVAAAARFRQLAEDSLAVEERKFLAGTSSNLAVAERQDAVASAQLAELAALLDYNKARAALLHVTGELLAARHIEVEAR